MAETANCEETATEVVIKTLETFGESEPEDVLVLFTNADGNLVWRSNIASVSMRIGMLRVAEHAMFRLCDQTNE